MGEGKGGGEGKAVIDIATPHPDRLPFAEREKFLTTRRFKWIFFPSFL
jgi:hypothetical protein